MIKLKLNIPLNYGKEKLAKGKIINLDVDGKGNILNSFWAKRLKDAAVDRCVEVVAAKPLVKNEKEKPSKKEESK